MFVCKVGDSGGEVSSVCDERSSSGVVNAFLNYW